MFGLTCYGYSGLPLNQQYKAFEDLVKMNGQAQKMKGEETEVGLKNKK